MDKQPSPSSDVDVVAMPAMDPMDDPNATPQSNAFKLLWIYNLSVEFTTAVFHGMLTRVVPEYYSFYQNQFWFTVGFAAFNSLVTLKVNKGLIGLQVFIAVLHLFWVFYGFSTVPVFLTAISTNHEECLPEINSCVREGTDISVFKTKMVIGVSVQLFFLVILYGDMKRLCLLLDFPILVPSQEAIQPVGIENKGAQFDCPIGNELPEKNPNDIIIAA